MSPIPLVFVQTLLQHRNRGQSLAPSPSPCYFQIVFSKSTRLIFRMKCGFSVQQHQQSLVKPSFRRPTCFNGAMPLYPHCAGYRIYVEAQMFLNELKGATGVPPPPCYFQKNSGSIFRRSDSIFRRYGGSIFRIYFQSDACLYIQYTQCFYFQMYISYFQSIMCYFQSYFQMYVRVYFQMLVTFRRYIKVLVRFPSY